MAEEFCERCEMTLAFCVHGNPPKAEPVYLKTGPTITAQIDGWCPDCGGAIEANVDEITHTEDGWVHAHHVPQQQSVPDLGGDQFEGFE